MVTVKAATDYRLETLKPYASIALPGKYARGTRPRITHGY